MSTEQQMLRKFLDPLKVCKRYKPKFGLGNRDEGVGINQFMDIYGTDPFYAWCGLNSELMYAAHKAAGGMTSVYRQIGKGCENIFKEIIIDATGYKDRASVEWSYKTKTSAGKDKTLSLDGRLALAEIENTKIKSNVTRWLKDYCGSLKTEVPKYGAVFEVRQGYKSKDSKRQNADIDNVAVAWSQGYLPVFAIFSGQIDGDLVLRYRNHRAGIVVGTLSGTSEESLFSFCNDVLDYDLADFFKRNSPEIKKEMHDTLEALLNA